jgi:hypothetical protein
MCIFIHDLQLQSGTTVMQEGLVIKMYDTQTHTNMNIICMHMHVCIYMRIYTYINTHTYTYTHILRIHAFRLTISRMLQSGTNITQEKMVVIAQHVQVVSMCIFCVCVLCVCVCVFVFVCGWSGEIRYYGAARGGTKHVYVCLYVCLCMCVSVCLSVCLSVCS